MQCSALRKNGHVVIKGRPCKIVDMSTSKTGKHGHAKVHLVAIDIFTGKKLEDISPSTHNMDVPNVTRTEYQLVNVDDGFLNLMTQDGTAKDDVKLPEGELGEQIQAGFDEGKDLLVTVTAAMGEEHALACKEAPKGNYSKKYGAQVKAIQEVFPEWNEDDLVSLLQETHGSAETAIERIAQGQATQWGSVQTKKSKKPPASAPVRGGGRGQRGRGSSRGGASGRGGGRGHRQTSSSTRPPNGEQAQDSTWGNSAAPGWGAESAAPAWGDEHKEPEEKEPEAAPKTNGTPVNGTHPPATVATPAQSVKPPTPAAKAPQPTAAPARSWASLLKTKPAPPPVAKQPSPAPKPQPPPQTQAPPPAPAPAPLEPEPAPQPEPEPIPEPEPEQEEPPAPEPVQEPEPEPEPEPVEEEKEEAPEPEPEVKPEPVPEPKVEPPAAVPPPPGLNLVTQQAPLPDSVPQAPQVSLPASVSLPAPAQAAWRTPAKIPTSRSGSRFPKSDQAVVLPSGYEDKLSTGLGGLSFGQFGNFDDEPKTNEPVQETPAPAHAPPSVTLPAEPPAPPVRKDEPAPPPHLTISDQLPQAQAQIQQQQQQQQITQPAPIQQQPQQERIPTQHQTPLASHIPAQPAPQPAPQQQAAPAQPQAQPQAQPPQEQPQQHVPLHTYEPFPQHAHGHGLGNTAVNLYQQHQHQHQHQQSTHSQSPFAQPQPQQPQQQTGLYGQQSYGQSFGQRAGGNLGGYPGHVQDENAGYGAFGGGGISGFERYGYDQGGHSHQAAGFYDSYNQGGFPPRTGAADDLAKSSPGQQAQNVIPNPNAAQAQPQQAQPQQPQQPQQQQPPNQQQQSGGYAPMPYFYAPYYQNQYFGQPSPSYGQPFVKYPPMYPQQSQQTQPQPQQSKTQGSLYAGQPEDQYGQQQQQGYDYSKSQGQVQGGLQSLLGGQTIRDKTRVGAVGQTQGGAGAGYYGAGAGGTGAGGAGVRYPGGYQQQAPEQGTYYSYPRQTPQQPNQSYGQWQ